MVRFATQVKRRRGTAAQNDAFTGAEGEIVVNLTDKSLRVHDGTTQGGFETLRQNMQNSVNITNCITEIPQDIKLELADGVLRLKAGSKVYLATGDSSFPAQTIAADIEHTTTYSGRYVVIRNSQTSLYFGNIDSCTSGTIADRPTSTPNASGLYFATDENKMYLTGNGGANWYSTTYMTLPIAIITVSGGAISSIDEVFNGFGYTGSTEFVFPGVSVLIPNGRNADGTLNNIKYTTSQVATLTINGNKPIHIAIRNNGTLGWWEMQATRYDANQNLNYYNNNRQYYAVVGKFDVVNGRIQNFTPYNTFRAADYNDIQPETLFASLLSALYPVGSVYISTANTNPMATLIPGSSWSLVSSGRALWTGNGSNGNTTIAAGLPNITGSFGTPVNENGFTTWRPTSGAFTGTETASSIDVGSYDTYAHVSSRPVNFSAQNSNSIYGNSTTVQPPAYVVNVWRRTA